MHEIVDRVSAWEGVLAFRPGPGDGSPELSWGDVFFYVAPDGIVPSGQPFATIVTKDYPGEPSSGLNGGAAYRVNIAAGDHRRHSGASPSSAPDPSTRDLLMPHPVYGDLGWLAVVNPGERTGERVMALLEAAHAAAWTRWQRRHGTERPSR